MSRPDDESHTDQAWREIVDNFGERASLTDEDRDPSLDPVDRDDVPLPGQAPDPVADRDPFVVLDRDETFVPPPAPPVGRPRTWRRALAWLGLLLAPAIAVVLAVTDVYVPSPLGLALVVAFVGGFVYLIATMPESPRDPWDDGSRV